jgi:hypothetical protein
VIFGPVTLRPHNWMEDWHPFLPLWPRHIDGVGYVWLELVERKSRFYCGPAGGHWSHEYREMPPENRCKLEGHEWAYLKSPSGIPMFKDYCVRCKARPE